MLFRILALLMAVSTHSILAANNLKDRIQQAEKLGDELCKSLVRNEIKPYWGNEESGLVYRVNTGKGEHHFFHVDFHSGKKNPAFDHQILANAFKKAVSKEVSADALPLNNVSIVDGGIVRFEAFGKNWCFNTANQEITADKILIPAANLISIEEAKKLDLKNGDPTTITFENHTNAEVEICWLNDGKNTSYGKIPAGGSKTLDTYAGHLWFFAKDPETPLAAVIAGDSHTIARFTKPIPPSQKKKPNLSPDTKWQAEIKDHNLVIQSAAGDAPIVLSKDGTAENPYSGPFHWSPDSRKLVAWRAKHVEPRKIHIVQSSPTDQLQPKLMKIDYPKPGDEISQPKPKLFHIGKPQAELFVDDALFNNPYKISDLSWAPDSQDFSFVYNQRGHQVMRVISVRADSGSARTIHEEKSNTFIDYSQKLYIHRLSKSREILWASERSGYNHLYLIDENSGSIKNPITKGNLNVRKVIHVDEEKRQLLIEILGFPGQNPYHTHLAKVNFDGTGFVHLTSGDGGHKIQFSPSKQYFMASWSRPDQPPVTEIRSVLDGKLIAELERADDSKLLEKNWNRPEPFTAKGRDGKTDIYGIMIKPTHFDPKKSYPVVEAIYAGPHNYHCPQEYMTWSQKMALAELGFIVVQIDGMGTNWRNKAFHDVCWKNLADAGLPDRIAWIKAVAATRPWMDLSRVGIYGGSAGGQNAMSALLHHGDFYKVAVADSGCHDNRMDKTWWNEAWMGWPVDESYVKNSNTTHANKLNGKLLLMVGELDVNVDPASTTQVVAALQKAEKDFDFQPIINEGHCPSKKNYGYYRLAEFLARHLGVKF